MCFSIVIIYGNKRKQYRQIDINAFKNYYSFKNCNKNDIIEKQTSVIVYSYISFLNKNYHIVCDICEDRLFTPLCRVMRNILKKNKEI